MKKVREKTSIELSLREGLKRKSFLKAAERSRSANKKIAAKSPTVRQLADTLPTRPKPK